MCCTSRSWEPLGGSWSRTDTPSLLPNYLRFKDTGLKSCLPGGLSQLQLFLHPGTISLPPGKSQQGRPSKRLESSRLDFGTHSDLSCKGLDRSGSPERLKTIGQKGGGKWALPGIQGSPLEGATFLPWLSSAPSLCLFHSHPRT